ncbi:MAG: transglutaminase-like domain-containing protein [Bacteroidetes bacterium]|nr:transglutaminase-like domain-containing protein [Bacteroidota bacterium]MBU1679229.1 transglutaminase-like domain-containing protein [Bacteroidota bacterium]MBU2507448.1 transglutaminase-like domain-containing protein [Bacteroidota bacterium]
MAVKSQLPFLIDLVDDEIDEVRSQVFFDLKEYGISLEEDLREFSEIIDKRKLNLIEPILEENRRNWLRKNWSSWIGIEDENEKLEYAMDLIAKFQLGLNETSQLSFLLDDLANRFQFHYLFGDEIDLANFLFQNEKLLGEKLDYYNPLNSNLIYTMKEKKGIPITLAIIYMLVGKRIGFEIQGCNFPGHFLAKLEYQNEITLIDCYGGGKIIYMSDLLELLSNTKDAVKRIIELPTTTNMIVRRVVNNLINAYKEKKDQTNLFFFSELLKSTPWK